MTHSTPRTLLVVVLLVLAGCQGLTGSSGPPSDQRAVDAVDRAREAALDSTSYRFTVDGQVQIRDDSRSRSIGIAGQGVVNLERRQANLTVRTDNDMRMGFPGARRAYLDDYTLDTECSRMGWARYNLTESTDWLNYTSLGQQFALLDRTNVYWNGTEVVDGVETAVVTASPTEQQLQAANTLPTGQVGAKGGANFENATVRAWIDTGTDRIQKVQREIHVSGGEATAVATITFHFSDYDEPTNITRPSFEDSTFQWESDCPGT